MHGDDRRHGQVAHGLALLDGTDLAQRPVTESSIDDAVRAYETFMLPRSARATQDCAGALDNLIPPTDS
ncbi:hypothetical protein AB0D83_10615 [Streptomyces decoyicus]|uniref:hypothetical protein n=1 Tax=Streptomyces decoyicus TaxID=249567 RepID=UPI0033C877D7